MILKFLQKVFVVLAVFMAISLCFSSYNHYKSAELKSAKAIYLDQSDFDGMSNNEFREAIILYAEIQRSALTETADVLERHYYYSVVLAVMTVICLCVAIVVGRNV